MTDKLSDRALQLINAASLVELSKAGDTDYPRWVNIKRGEHGSAQMRSRYWGSSTLAIGGGCLLAK